MSLMPNNLDGLFICDVCSTHFKYPINDPSTFIYENALHKIDLGQIGYGSELDGAHVYFCMCDNCLVKLVDSLRPERKELILNDYPFSLDE